MAIELALLHGFAASPFTWRRVQEPLGVRHRVVALERPWAGFDEQVAATVQALDHAQFEAPVLVGHSAGAEVALGVALAQPDRVRALVLIAPVVGQGPPPFARALARAPGWGLVGPSLLRGGTRFIGPVLRRLWYDPSQVDAAVVDGYRRPLLEPGVAEALWAMTANDRSRSLLLSRLGEVTHPALVIIGDHDPWARALPLTKTQTVMVERCGHLPHEERPERTVAEIEAFLTT